ncbi:MAG TPA: 2-C-methyl-D-erythritol 4-phosphate cytidylyltransferase [Gemmatimonadales bacterium]|nr:2-C-methyl-D-erythritol 4-phosphate cytidylyltransferase [Gemmatimonadales bacterium]
MRDVGVIVVAAGRGERMGGEVPKQYLSLAGHPVLLHALRPFVSHPEVACVVVVLPAADAAEPPAWLATLRGETLATVAGGASRAESVRAGLAALPDGCEVVLVHDGARPFPPREAIDGGIRAARAGHAALPALPVAETLKRADDFGRVLGTVPRAGLWLAQTPQAFPRGLLRRAHAADLAGDLVPTDDAMLVEMLGAVVELLPGSARNLKITTRDDLALAEWFAGQG